MRRAVVGGGLFGGVRYSKFLSLFSFYFNCWMEEGLREIKLLEIFRMVVKAEILTFGERVGQGAELSCIPIIELK